MTPLITSIMSPVGVQTITSLTKQYNKNTEPRHLLRGNLPEDVLRSTAPQVRSITDELSEALRAAVRVEMPKSSTESCAGYNINSCVIPLAL